MQVVNYLCEWWNVWRESALSFDFGQLQRRPQLVQRFAAKQCANEHTIWFQRSHYRSKATGQIIHPMQTQAGHHQIQTIFFKLQYKTRINIILVVHFQHEFLTVGASSSISSFVTFRPGLPSAWSNIVGLLSHKYICFTFSARMWRATKPRLHPMSAALSISLFKSNIRSDSRQPTSSFK